MENEPRIEKTTLNEIKTSLEDLDTSIDDEIRRTGQKWFNCFGSWSWKTLPMAFNTAKLKGEITEEQEKAIQRELVSINEEATRYEHEHGGPRTYVDGIPPVEIRNALKNRLRAVLDLL